METSWNTALWRQFDIAIDTLENALVTCPDSLWTQRLWRVPPDDPIPPGFAEFWNVAYHTLFWLDLYLTGSREEEFAPPAPFTWVELDPVWVLPARPYTKEELLAYLASTRQRGHATLVALTGERARQIVDYPWAEGHAVSFLELQMYNMRHVQEHAAQLHLFLGQSASPAVPDQVSRAKDEPGSQ